jgi:hypothetical protein
VPGQRSLRIQYSYKNKIIQDEVFSSQMEALSASISLLSLSDFISYKKDPSGFDFIKLKLGDFCY